jgi:hypothetical protein
VAGVATPITWHVWSAALMMTTIVTVIMRVAVT